MMYRNGCVVMFDVLYWISVVLLAVLLIITLVDSRFNRKKYKNENKE